MCTILVTKELYKHGTQGGGGRPRHPLRYAAVVAPRKHLRTPYTDLTGRFSLLAAGNGARCGPVLCRDGGAVLQGTATALGVWETPAMGTRGHGDTGGVGDTGRLQGAPSRPAPQLFVVVLGRSRRRGDDVGAGGY